MSSTSETSSQVRQFGLYRTIDARTEEFLKLSRKRQIKQGCACAAISTIITVAVVIIVILIYEYSILIPDSTSKAALNQNWLALMNTTVDGLPIEVKIDKAKLSLNPATIQILPLILKALKKNIYFNKIIEDPSPSTPKHDKKELEEVITKSIFSGDRNWMRMPVSRLYAIEYRTSPIAYPTRNIDYYTKIRKIRDYQRVMNYVDKMISEKIPQGTTVPMKKIFATYKKPIIEYTTPMIKPEIRNISKQDVITDTYDSTSSKPDVNSICDCPKRISDIFNQFISRLKNLLPDLSNELKISKPCNHNQRNTPEKSDFNIKIGEPRKDIGLNITNEAEVLEYNSSVQTSRTPYKNNGETNNHKTTPSQKSTFRFIKTMSDNKRHSLQTEKNEFLPNTAAKKQKNRNTNYSKTPDQAALSKNVTTVKDYITQKSTNLSKKNLFHSIIPEKYTEDYKHTTSDISEYFKILDAHSLELVKSKIISSRKNQNISDKKDVNVSALDFASHENISNTKVVTEISLNIANSTYDSTTYTLKTETTTSNYFNKNINSSSTDLLNNSKEEKKLVNITTQYTILPNDLKLQEDIEKESVDFTEIAVRNIEDEIIKLNTSSNYNNVTEGSEYEWEIVKVIEDNFKDNSYQKAMIPQSRSSYLEIQRGEWRNDENQDYDNNINNYLLD